MKVCPRCGYNNPDDAEFCEKCRYYFPPSNPSFQSIQPNLNQLTQNPPTQNSNQNINSTPFPVQPNYPQMQYVKICPRCNFVNPSNANYCAACGYPLQFVTPVPANAPYQYPQYTYPQQTTQQQEIKKNVKFPYLKFFLAVGIAYVMIGLILYFLG
ncbi:zinc-ribbon domain-containing protein [Acidianus sulfidivorans]|nr:zinc ribbon domain-containing protein [Acidianus sulfidivorans]